MKKRWISWLIVLLIVLLLGVSVWRALAARKAQQQSAAAAAAQGRAQQPVQLLATEVITVQRQTMVVSVPVSGALRAVESAMVKARSAGELQGLSVREGDRVRAGQELARIDATDARARLRQAQQQADAARAQVDINQRQFSNNQALVDQGFISSTALLTSQANLAAARASHQAAEAAADVARKAVDDTVVRSPLTGLVSQRLVQPGERVSVDSRIVEVVDLSRLEIEALLSPADSLGVRVGQRAQLQLEGIATPVTATVVRINPSAQASSRTVPVYLQVVQPDAEAPLRQGLFLQGTLDTGRVDVAAVPLDAVRTDKPAPYVQVVQAGRVSHVAVRTGVRAVRDGQTWVAVEGLADAATVLQGTVGALPEGTPVALAAPAVAPVSGPSAQSAPARLPSEAGTPAR